MKRLPVPDTAPGGSERFTGRVWVDPIAAGGTSGDLDGVDVEWGEHVTDAEYEAATQFNDKLQQ